MDGAPELRPVTERVRGGLRPRLAALLAGTALLAVSWVGLSGRGQHAAPPPSAAALLSPAPARTSGHAPAATAQATAAPTPRRPTPMATPQAPRPAVVTDPRSPPRGEDYFGATLIIDERVYFSLLSETAPGQFYADLRLGFPAPETPVTLELVQLWTKDERPDFQRIGGFELSYGPLLRGSHATRVVLHEEIAARKKARDAPRIVREGYTVIVRTESRGDRASLRLEVTSGHAGRDDGNRLPMIRLLAQPAKPRATMVLGESWVAGY